VADFRDAWRQAQALGSLVMMVMKFGMFLLFGIAALIGVITSFPPLLEFLARHGMPGTAGEVISRLIFADVVFGIGFGAVEEWQDESHGPHRLSACSKSFGIRSRLPIAPIFLLLLVAVFMW